MAYNPFDFFRRNQKTFFAVLTVVVMFMFVLSFGRGDIFEAIPRWLGNRAGETLAVIDGHKVTEAELRDLRVRRSWANTFLAAAHINSVNRVAAYIEKNQSKASEELKLTLQNFLMTRRNKPDFQSGREVPNTMYVDLKSWFDILQGRLPAQAIPQVQQNQMGQLYLQFQAVIANKAAKTDDVELAHAGQKLIQLDTQTLFGGSSYFHTVPLDDKRPNLMEFELWRRKADKLGIALTRADAESMVMAEFFGQFDTEEWAKLENSMLSQEGSKGFTRDKLRDALIDELKVRTAMTVVLGPLPGSGGEDPNYGRARQTFASPYEMYQYYTKECDQSNYAVISVPVANFVDKVVGEPTVQELNDLFKRYKNDEPSPERELPGLKEPRKLKFEWLEVKGDEPYFKERAKEYLPKLEMLARASGALTAPLFPNLGAVLAAVAPTGIDQPLLQSAYEEYSQRVRNREKELWFPQFTQVGTGYTDRSVVQPRALAAAAAAAAASQFTRAGPFDPLIALGTAALAAERDARINAGAALLMPPTLATAYIVGSQVPSPLPLAVVADDLKTKVAERYARQVAYDDLHDFSTKLSELGKSKDTAPARDYLEKFIKDRGLKTGASQEFRDQYSVGEDLGLKPLKDRSQSAHLGADLPNRFGQIFFGVQHPQTGQYFPFTSFYAPSPYPNQISEASFVGSIGSPPTNESTFLYWRTAELPAEAPKTLDGKAKERTIAAWKHLKARELARAKAEELAKVAAGFGDSKVQIDQRVLDAYAALQAEFPTKEAKDRVKLFTIPNVAPMQESIGFSVSRNPVTPFQLQPTENMPYPDYEKMRADLLGNRDKPLSTAFVMPDKPRNVYYVTVLQSKDERGVEDFGRNIYAPTIPQMSAGPIILNQFRGEQMAQARQEAVALLKAELKYEKESPDLAKKSESD
jgi:hypothetical protein